MVEKQEIRFSVTHGYLMDLQATIDELRAVLAPLLDQPWAYGPQGGDAGQCCAWCLRFADEEGPHAPNCPVLRKDALLGR